MTRLLAIAALAALWSATALAQAPAAASAPAAAPAPQAEKPASAAQGDIKLVQGAGQSKVTEDARRCLEMSTNTDIIKCAEPYLPTKK